MSENKILLDTETIKNLAFDCVKKTTNKDWTYDKILFELGIEVM